MFEFNTNVVQVVLNIQNVKHILILTNIYFAIKITNKYLMKI